MDYGRCPRTVVTNANSWKCHLIVEKKGRKSKAMYTCVRKNIQDITIMMDINCKLTRCRAFLLQVTNIRSDKIKQVYPRGLPIL